MAYTVIEYFPTLINYKGVFVIPTTEYLHVILTAENSSNVILFLLTSRRKSVG